MRENGRQGTKFVERRHSSSTTHTNHAQSAHSRPPRSFCVANDASFAILRRDPNHSPTHSVFAPAIYPLPAMERAELESTSSDATERLAEAVGRVLTPGDVVLIAGDVGTGKTTFVRGACRALGVVERVTSPSFTIGQTYAGRIPVAHIDLFRLEDLGGEDPALLADYLTPERVAFVEWPGAGLPWIERDHVVLELELTHEGGDRRGLRAVGRRAPVEALRTG